MHVVLCAPQHGPVSASAGHGPTRGPAPRLHTPALMASCNPNPDGPAENLESYLMAQDHPAWVLLLLVGGAKPAADRPTTGPALEPHIVATIHVKSRSPGGRTKDLIALVESETQPHARHPSDPCSPPASRSSSSCCAPMATEATSSSSVAHQP